MSTLLTEIQRFKVFLRNIYDADESEGITRLVLEELFQINPHRLHISGNVEISKPQLQQLEDVFIRLLNHEPIQYILGFSWFMDERYLVNKSTLIPRQETEELIRWIAESPVQDHTSRILDIGTGSGCIGISLKKSWPNSELIAIDYSSAAIDTAKINARNILDDSAKDSFYVQDILEKSWWEKQDYFDIIVSNPPYVLDLEKQTMHANVLQYEPASALFVPNEDPFKFYLPIATFAKDHLQKDGKLYFEINPEFGNEMKEMLHSLGFESEIKKDMQGKDRMIKASFAG